MRGDLEISKVAEFLVLMVVLAIGIGLVTIYSQNSKQFIGESANGKYNTTIFKANSFSDTQLNLYLKSCVEMVGDKGNEDFTCYILEGDMSKVDTNNLRISSDRYTLDSSSFKTRNPIATIKYDSISKKIIIVN